MTWLNKPLVVSSLDAKHSNENSNGNTVFVKEAKIGGQHVQLHFVIRSDKDVLMSRNKSYRLLVP